MPLAELLGFADEMRLKRETLLSDFAVRLESGDRPNGYLLSSSACSRRCSMLATNKGISWMRHPECYGGYSQSAAKDGSKRKERGRIEHAEVVAHRLVEEDTAE